MGASTSDVTNCVWVLLLALMTMSGSNLQGALAVAASERIILYREQASNMYSSIVYAVVTALVSAVSSVILECCKTACWADAN